MGIVFSTSLTSALQQSIEATLQSLFGPEIGLRFNVGGVGAVNINVGTIGAAPGINLDSQMGGYVTSSPNGQPSNYGIVDIGVVRSAQYWPVQGQKLTFGAALGQVAAHELGHELYLPDYEFGGIMAGGNPFVPNMFTSTGKTNLLNRCQYLKNHPKGGGSGRGGVGGGSGGGYPGWWSDMWSFLGWVDSIPLGGDETVTNVTHTIGFDPE